MLAFLHTRGGDSSKQAADRLLGGIRRRSAGAARRRRDRLPPGDRRDPERSPPRRADRVPARPAALVLGLPRLRRRRCCRRSSGPARSRSRSSGSALAVEVHSLSVFALNLVTGLGLGLAIDYSLFIVSRWREEAARHGHGPEALAATMRSAGRTVVFSALTVAASMACLLVFPQQFLYSMGVGGVLVALAAGLVALVPAAGVPLLARPAGSTRSRRSGCSRSPSGGRWARLAAWVMRRPGRVAARLGLGADRARDPGACASTSSASTRRRCRPPRARARSPRRSSGRTSAGATRPITAITDGSSASGGDRRARGGTWRGRRPAGAARWQPVSGASTSSRATRASPTARSSSSTRCARSCPTHASPGRPPRSSTSRRRSPRTCRGHSRSSRSRPAR